MSGMMLNTSNNFTKEKDINIANKENSTKNNAIGFKISDEVANKFRKEHLETNNQALRTSQKVKLDQNNIRQYNELKLQVFDKYIENQKKKLLKVEKIIELEKNGKRYIGKEKQEMTDKDHEEIMKAVKDIKQGKMTLKRYEEIMNDVCKDQIKKHNIDEAIVREAQYLFKDYYNKHLNKYVSEEELMTLLDKVKFLSYDVFRKKYESTNKRFTGEEAGFYYPNDDKIYVTFPIVGKDFKEDGFNVWHMLNIVVHEMNHRLGDNKYQYKDGRVVVESNIQGVTEKYKHTDRTKYMIELLKHGVVGMMFRRDDWFYKKKIHSLKEHNVQLNEAINEYLARNVMGNKKRLHGGYDENVDLIEYMEDGFGKETIELAFYKNQPKLLQDRFENVLGKDSWNKFTKALDDTLKPFPNTKNEKKLLKINKIRENGSKIAKEYAKKFMDKVNKDSSQLTIRYKNM